MKPLGTDSPEPNDSARAAARERQKKARLDLLEYLLEGQPPITEEERAAVRLELGDGPDTR